jgi:choline dehydrogenase-like flavoprotein
MAPGIAPLPAAEGPATDGRPHPRGDRVDVAGELERYLASLPPRTVRLIRVSLRVVDLLPFPWRFSRTGVVAREEFLRRLEQSSSPIKRDLVMLLKALAGVAYGSDPRVERAVGFEATCALAAGSSPPGPQPRAPEGLERPQSTAPVDAAPLGELEVPGSVEECDVVVVGSGAGGAASALTLAAAGFDVLVLGAGRYMDRHSYPSEPLAALAALYRDGGLTVAEGRPSIPTPVGRAVGGTTVINSGTALRAPDRVLDAWAREGGIEWARDLAPDYAEAEEMLSVKAVDPERMGRNGQLLRDGAEALGASHLPLRRNAGDCIQCSSCPVGCRLDAKRAMHVSYLPRAVAAGARIRAGVEVRRIRFEGVRATGVECVAGMGDPLNPRPRPYAVRSRLGVVLAGGAFGTPELLMRSGFRSPSGELGRNLRIHPACWVGARFTEEVRGWEGVMQSYAVDEWQGMGLLLEATFTPLAFGGGWLPGTGREHQHRLLGYRNVASVGVHLSDRSAGRVRLAGGGSLRISYRLTRDDAHRLSFGIARTAELLYAAGATEVYPQISGLPTVARDRIPELEASPPSTSALRLEAFHPMGTARMDADPRLGVTAPDGAVHGARGIYVADGSVMPSSIGVNPMLTIVAVATRVGRSLAERLS